MAFLKYICVVLIAFAAYYSVNRKGEINRDDVQYGMRVVVTGASYGIGREVAQQTAQLGARLLVTARTESKLVKVVEECKKLGSPDAYYITADMSDEESPHVVINEALKRLGGIDMLILNHVGGLYFSSYNDIDAMKRMLQSNSVSYAHMASLAMISLEKNRGRIVAVSSVDGTFGVPYLSSYCSSKGAVNGYFRSLDLELASNKSNVSVSICQLGFINTESGQKNTKNYPYLPPSSVQECGKEIIRGAMNRNRSIFFPTRIGWLMELHSILPDVIRNQLIL